MPAHDPFSLSSDFGSKSSTDTNPNPNSSITSGAAPDESADEIEASSNSGSQEETALDRDSIGFARKASEFHGHRAMKIWLIIMISLRIRPITSVYNELWRKARFRNLFRERLRYIKANLTVTPQSGLILHFPNHPGGDQAEDLEDQYVDVHSAIAVLRRKYGDLPSEMDALESSVADLPISASWYADGAQPIAGTASCSAAVPNSDAASPPKRDQTKAVVGRMNNSMQKLLLRMVEDRYGTLAPQTLATTRDAIAQDLQTPGLGPVAIEKQLKLLMAHRDLTISD